MTRPCVCLAHPSLLQAPRAPLPVLAWHKTAFDLVLTLTHLPLRSNCVVLQLGTIALDYATANGRAAEFKAAVAKGMTLRGACI
jgi:hypothetical protein